MSGDPWKPYDGWLEAPSSSQLVLAVLLFAACVAAVYFSIDIPYRLAK